MSSTSSWACPTAKALPMRASSNIVCTAWRVRSSTRLACAISASRDTGGATFTTGTETAGTAASVPAASAAGTGGAATATATATGSGGASPRAVSIHTSFRRAARIRSRSAGDSSKKERFQNGFSSQERPRRSTYIPSMSSLLVIFFSTTVLHPFKSRHLLAHYQYHTPKIMIKPNKLVYMAISQQKR